MHLSLLDELANKSIVEANVAPAAALGCARFAAGEWRLAVGAAGGFRQEKAAPTSVFDLASITKPLVAIAGAKALRAAGISLNLPLGEALPGLRETASGALPLELFLSHRTGLKAHIALFDAVLEQRAHSLEGLLQKAAQARRAECGDAPADTGFAPLYSDLGYILFGAALRALTQTELDVLVQNQVVQELGLELGSARQWRQREPTRLLFPTEVCACRGGMVQGTVHDENAWILAGNACAGHAGLFGTVPALLNLGMALLDVLARRKQTFMHFDTLAELIRVRPGGTLRAGFDGRADRGSSAGIHASAKTFGHLGFTGTSFWCDPEAGVVSVLLTNRTFPFRSNLLIREARPRVHAALYDVAVSLHGKLAMPSKA